MLNCSPVFSDLLSTCWAENFSLGVNFRGSSEMTVTDWFKNRSAVRRKVLFWYKIWQWVSYHSMQHVFFPLLSDKHSVDEHLSELMQKVSDDTSVWLYTTHSFIHSFSKMQVLHSGELRYYPLTLKWNHIPLFMWILQGATITTDRERLLNVLAQLKQEEFKEFKWFLQDSDILTDLPCIPRQRLEKGDMLDVVDLMLQTYSQQSVELTKKVLQKIHRNDLVQKL